MAWTRHHQTRYGQERPASCCQESSAVNSQVSLQPSNRHPSCSGLSRWGGFVLTIKKLPRHIINQPVYYFVVRWRTLTMQTDVPMSAWMVHVLPRGSYMETNLLSSYLASMESKQGEANLKTYTSLIHEARAHLPTTEQPQPPEFAVASSLPILLWLSTVISYSFMISWLGLRVIFLLTGFLLLPPLLLTVKVLKGAHQLLPCSNYKEQSCWDALPTPPYSSFTI